MAGLEAQSQALLDLTVKTRKQTAEQAKKNDASKAEIEVLVERAEAAAEAAEAAQEGKQGPPGAQGLPGPAGAQGPAGPAGLSGPQGLTGPLGAQGPQGIPGPIGGQGPAGPQGLQGPQGLTGAAGPPGPAAGDAPRSSSSATINVLPNDTVVVVLGTLTAAKTVQLGSAAARAARIPLVIVDGDGGADVNNITILPAAGETLPGGRTDLVIDTAEGVVRIHNHPAGDKWTWA